MKRFSVISALLISFIFCAQAEDAWPRQVVTIEEIKVLSPIRILVPKVRARGEVTRAAVMRVHINEGGSVRRIALVESCGSPEHDEAALHAMRNTRFAPFLIDGTPSEVTLVVPLHIPLTKKLSAQ